VGRATWYKLSAIYTAVKRLAELDQEAEENMIIEELDGSFDGDYPLGGLKYGSKGGKVRELQVYLSTLAEAYGLKKNAITGIFDYETLETLMEFQKAFNLPILKSVDRRLWNTIYCAYVDLEDIYSVEDLTRYPGYVLRKNFSNKDVRRLKTMLRKISTLYKEIPEVNVDRDFDGRTPNAVLRFQRTFGLVQNGEVDINTWRNIVFVYLALDSGRDINTSDILFPFPFELKLGDNNGYVAVLKEYMNVLAKNGYNIRILPIDNIFDLATERNVKSLQKVFDLRRTGVVDTITWEKIASTYNDFFTGRR